LLETHPEIERTGAASSALAMAAEKGHTSIVNLLLAQEKVPTAAMIGYPLESLIQATKYEYHLIIESLRLSMDLSALVAQSEIDDECQRHLLLISAACGWNNLVEDLLQRGCSTDFLHTNRFLWSIKEKSPLPRCLYRQQFPSSLALAAHRGHYDTVQLLLNYITEERLQLLLNERDPTPLLLAIDGCHESIIDILLDKNTDPNHLTDGLIPVFFKTVYTPAILERLFKREANPALVAGHFYNSQKESLFVQTLAVGNLDTVKFLRSLSNFEESILARNSSQVSFLEAAADGGALVIENLLDNGYQVLPGNFEVARTLQIALSKADSAILSLLFERQLIGNLTLIHDTSILALVDSPSRDLAAMAVTLDMLLVQGIEMETREREKSPLHDLSLRHDRVVLFKLLLDRGADPLRKDGEYGDTPLTQASRTGSKELLRIMLKSLESRSIPLGKSQAELGRAEQMAESGLEKSVEVDVRPLLRRFYWRKRYQN